MLLLQAVLFGSVVVAVGALPLSIPVCRLPRIPDVGVYLISNQGLGGRLVVRDWELTIEHVANEVTVPPPPTSSDLFKVERIVHAQNFHQWKARFPYYKTSHIRSVGYDAYAAAASVKANATVELASSWPQDLIVEYAWRSTYTIGYDQAKLVWTAALLPNGRGYQVVLAPRVGDGSADQRWHFEPWCTDHVCTCREIHEAKARAGRNG